MRFFFFLLLLSACRSDVLSLSDLQDHRHDLALAMSVKLASKKTDSEFALVRRRELPSGMNIKELALDLFEKFRIGKRNGKGVLILFVEKTKEVKIEVSYALEGILTDALCRRLENAAQTYFLSDIPQDYFSELLITMSNAVLEGQSPEEDQIGRAHV